jgi:hypothetical protein
MPDMIALKELYYDGKRIMRGERFEIREGLVRLYTILKRAEMAPADDPPTMKPRGRRAMLPADPEPPPAAGQPAGESEPHFVPGRYARRDMRPVDDET